MAKEDYPVKSIQPDFSVCRKKLTSQVSIMMAALVIMLTAAKPPAQAAAPDPSVVGQWSAPFDLPIVAVSTALLHTGDVLIWDETSADATWLWNPSSGGFTQVPNLANQFCSGQVTLADGRVFLMGGGETPFVAIPDATYFDPKTAIWTLARPMFNERWYPTATTLPDGRVLVVSGSGRCGGRCPITIPELYNPVTNSWSELPGADLLMPNYPFMFQLPDGRLLYAGSDEADTETRTLNIETQAWTLIDSAIVPGGSAAMFRPGRVIKAGSSTEVHPPAVAAINDAYVIDMNQSRPTWQQVGSMAYPRAFHTLTLLPDGNVAVTGGLTTTDNLAESQAVLPAEIWNAATGNWSTMASMQTPRSYHSVGLLLPDGRVFVAGSGRLGTMTNRLNAEIFSPPYLFKGPRPTISSVQGKIGYGSPVFVETPDSAGIVSVSLVRPGAVTHAFDQNQRYVALAFQPINGGLTVQLPNNANIAPPGYYMLFLVNAEGVPSIAAFVRLPAASETTVPPPNTELIIDNAQAGVQDPTGGRTFTGSWCTSPASNQFGANELHNCFGNQLATYRWTPAIPQTGAWDVYVWWGAQPFQATSAAVTVVSAEGSASRMFNQQTGGGQWVLHGRYNFIAGSSGYAEVNNNGAGHVAADALKFVRAVDVDNPVPVLSLLSTDTATAGAGPLTLTVTGANFVASSVVRWNGSDRPTTFVSASQLRAAISVQDLAVAGTVQVTVFTGAPGGGTSNNLPFTITAPPPTSEIILDNAPAGRQDPAGGRTFTGSWCQSTASNQFGPDALHNCFGAQAASYRWTPDIAEAGAWDVYVWWDAQPFQSTSVAVTVVSAEGSATRTFNEQIGGGQWILHGRYNFNTGNTGFVQVTNNGSGHIGADAVRFVRAP